MEYFTVLLRYIHQNPVKAGIVEKVSDYEYSSWGEYDGMVESVFQICDVDTVLNRISFEDLNALVNEPLSDDINCLDMEEQSKSRPSDDQVWGYIMESTGVTNSSAFQQLDNDLRLDILKKLKGIGASHRQLERLTITADSGCRAVQVPRNVYHTFIPHEDGTAIFEAKDRAYDPDGTEEFLEK